MIVPVLTSLDTVPAADAFGRIEQDTSCYAIVEPGGWNEAAILLNNTPAPTVLSIAHASMYHVFFAVVNYQRVRERDAPKYGLTLSFDAKPDCDEYAAAHVGGKQRCPIRLAGARNRALSTSRISTRAV